MNDLKRDYKAHAWVDRDEPPVGIKREEGDGHLEEFGSSLEEITEAMQFVSDNKDIVALDLCGVWWMKDNPFPEVLASLSNATSGKDKEGNLVIHVFTDAAGAWSWPSNWWNSSMSHATMLFYYLLLLQRDATSHLEFVFQKDGNAIIQSTLGGSGFMKTDDPDVWIRPMGPNGPFDTSSKYYFTRIIDGSGRPTKHWNTWQEFASGRGCCGADTKMVAYSSHDWWGRVRSLSCWYCGSPGCFYAQEIDITEDELS